MEVIFENFFRKLDISEILNNELSILNNNVGNNIDVSSKYSQYGLIKIFGIVVLFSS